ncbi:TnsA endonuclease N-terminal domain-containing protein [Denitratisoma sp. agr-D3]
MLTDTELADYLNSRELLAKAREVVHQVRKSPPTRRVKSGVTNVPCRFSSRKMGTVIQAESHRNELPTIVSWEYDPDTFEFYDQPPRIKLTYQDKTGHRRGHMATPDFFVLQKEFTGWIECKTEEWLKKEVERGSLLYVADGPGQWRCPPGEEYAASLGLAFRVRSSIETNWTAVRNAEFISDYLDDKTPTATEEQLKLAIDALRGQAWILLKGLLGYNPDLLPADAIFSMVARGQLYVDQVNELLSAPERTKVFRDESTAKAYRLCLAAQEPTAAATLNSIAIEPGASLIWDGRPMTICSVGDSHVFLKDENKRLVTVTEEEIQHLVRDGMVQGLPIKTTAIPGSVEEALLSASPEEQEIAYRRYCAIFPEKQTENSADTTVTANPRTLRHWHKLYLRSQQKTGIGFIGLLPKIHLRGNRNRKIDQAVIDVMREVIDEFFAKPAGWPLVSCWGEVRNRCEKKDLSPPGEKSFRQEIRRRRSYELQAIREGEKAAYDKEEFQWYLEPAAPRHGERPFEIGHIDHTELDIQLVGSRYGENLSKAWLTVLVDAATRYILAWVIRFEEPSYRSCMLLLRECLRRHSRIPRYIVVDNGPEFASTDFECLLALLESHKKSRPGGKPRFGSVVERFFGISNKGLIHNLTGNNLALQNPRRMSKSHDPRELAIWTLPELCKAFGGYVDQVYHVDEHSALGMSPKVAMAAGLANTGLRSHKLIPYSKALLVAFLPSTPKGTAKVESSRGVKINYIHYWAEAFRDPQWEGKSVKVRYDPDDVSLAFAWLKDRWVPCRSEHAAELHGHSEREIRLITQELQAKKKNSGNRRAITASLIATYLKGTAATEKILLQDKRHKETMAAQAQPLAAQLGIADKAIPAENDFWNDLEQQFFGELA